MVCLGMQPLKAKSSTPQSDTKHAQWSDHERLTVEYNVQLIPNGWTAIKKCISSADVQLPAYLWHK